MHFLASFVVLVILAHRNAEAGQRCLSCNEVPTPQSCTHITLCGDHESCFTESFISESGTFFYNVGCMSKSKCSASHVAKRGVIVTCIECCSTDFCNVEGCGISAVPREKRGPYCYHCEVQESLNSCLDVTVCGIDEACILERSVDHLPNKYYKSRCGEKSMCLEAQHIHTNEQSTPNPSEAIVGKRYSIFGDCPACCHTDFCNNNCTQNNSVAIHGMTQITTSFTMTNAPVATLTSTKPTSATTHPEQTKGTQIVTDVYQDHTSNSMPSTTLSLTTTKPTVTVTNSLLTEVTHQSTHVHQGQISTHQPTTCESQDGFHHLGHSNGCVLYVKTAMDWQSASNYCRKYQSHLVSIDSQNKQDAIHKFATTQYTNNDPWIGLVSTHSIHHWRWESGMHYSYNYWAVDQPAGAGTCVVMHTGGRWINKLCSSHHSFICQK